MTLKKISSKRQTLGDRIYTYLRDEIISLKLEPGQMVYENELASSFGVSRTPVREAFRLLLAEEFIEILPQRGVRIAYISKKKVDEACFVRESLEVSAFKLVAEKWNNTEDYYKKIHEEVLKLLKDQKSAASSQDYAQFFYLDEAFHRTILEQADNATLLFLINQVRGHVNRLRFLEFQDTRDTRRIIYEHEQIFDAITTGNVGETETLLINHLRNFTDYSKQIIQKHPGYFEQ